MTTHVPGTVYTSEEWFDLQTLVPLPHLVKSVQALDSSRLGRQRLHTLRALNALSGKKPGWFDHPAVRMWAGHERALITYGLLCCLRWRRMGHTDHVFGLIADHESHFGVRAPLSKTTRDGSMMPSWWGREDVHRSHRLKLVVEERFRDEPVHYAEQWPEMAKYVELRVSRGVMKSEGDADYVWPIEPQPLGGRPVPSRADIGRELRRAEERSRVVRGEGEVD